MNDTEVYYKAVMERLKRARIQNSMTQDALAQAIGVSRKQIYRYEKGIQDVPVTKFMAICYVLGLGIEEVMSQEDL